MALEWVRAHCLSQPHATEHIQWGADLVFKIGGKMFAIVVLEPAKVCMSFKTSPEAFVELTERQGIIPAPYMARAQWVALETPDALTRPELARLIADSYRMVFEKLPKKTQVELNKRKGARVPRPAASLPAGSSGITRSRSRSLGAAHRKESSPAPQR
jgi:predicted DNA-binding protein (MmcQ/YjbR family)